MAVFNGYPPAKYPAPHNYIDRGHIIENKNIYLGIPAGPILKLTVLGLGKLGETQQKTMQLKKETHCFFFYAGGFFVYGAACFFYGTKCLFCFNAFVLFGRGYLNATFGPGCKTFIQISGAT